MRYTPFVAAMALAVLGACGGNKDNAGGGQPPATTDTSAGSMSSPSSSTPSAAPSTTPPAATPAPGTPSPDTSAMQHDTNMKKMSGRKHHKASADTTTH